ncbi:hypothetical protein ACVIGB_005943 [Bradyrhizobium sp. USDA 4341]
MHHCRLELLCGVLASFAGARAAVALSGLLLLATPLLLPRRALNTSAA